MKKKKKKKEERLVILKEYPDVKFNGTYVDEKGMGICDWEAPNAVREIVEKALGKC